MMFNIPIFWLVSYLTVALAFIVILYYVLYQRKRKVSGNMEPSNNILGIILPRYYAHPTYGWWAIPGFKGKRRRRRRRRF